MHRYLLGLTDPKIQADHKNLNGLDNRLENLRVATPRQNNINREKLNNCSSKYKGVNVEKYGFRVRIRIMNENNISKRLHLGYFQDEIEAAKVYDEAAKKYHGEFAILNFPDDSNGTVNKVL